MATHIQTSKNIWLLIISLLLIGSGFYVIFNPITALLASALFMGIVFILMGIGYLLIFSQSKSYMVLTLGILDMLIGLIFLTNLGITALTMPIIFALWCLFIGITQLAAGFQMKEMADPSWSWILTAGIAGILFSFLIFFYPVIGTVTLTLLMGGYLIIYGAFELTRFIRGW